MRDKNEITTTTKTKNCYIVIAINYFDNNLPLLFFFLSFQFIIKWTNLKELFQVREREREIIEKDSFY
jgi:hypothetical protein